MAMKYLKQYSKIYLKFAIVRCSELLLGCSAGNDMVYKKSSMIEMKGSL